MNEASLTGGEMLAKCLEAQSVDRIFCVPGESYLAVLDALHDSPIEMVVARQEGGAAMMAEADGKLTGRPGVCFVTRGPGATNASAGVHVAQQDSTPMILFVGQIGRDMRGRDAFQEVDYRQMFGGIAKWVEEITNPARIPEIISHAWHVAMSGRPGPVVLSLPEDMLREAAPADITPARRVEVSDSAATEAQMQWVRRLLVQAERPIVILGGSRWSPEAVRAVQKFAALWELPVTCSFRRQMLFDAGHECYAGDVGLGINPALRERVQGADVILLLGGRLSENPSQGFSLLGIPESGQMLIHVHPGAEELGRIYAPNLGIVATPGAFLTQALELEVPARRLWAAETQAAHQAYIAWSEEPPKTPGNVEMGEVMRHLREVMPSTTVMANGAGNYATWLHRFWRFGGFGTQLAPTSGSMGYGLPAAIAGKLRRSSREVVCFAGDGCFQMTMQEFGTACQLGANIIVLVIDNGIYGTIRMHQEREYPGRVIGTDITNPDFAAIARAYGGFGATVTETRQFPAVLEAARKANRPALLHLIIDPEAITPDQTLTEITRAGPNKG